MILAHYKAVQALIPAQGFAVYLGQVKGTPSYPYVVLWGDLGTEATEAMCGDPDHLDLRIRATYSALGFEQCLWVAQKVRTTLTRKTPVVPGWFPGRLNQSALTDVQTDFDVTVDGSNPMFAVDEFALISRRG